MKILLGNNFLGPHGGAEVMLYGQYKILQEKGHDISLYGLYKEPFFDIDNLQKDFFPEYIDYSTVQGFDKIKYIPRRFYNVNAKNQFDKFFEDTKPEIVHFGNIKSGLTYSVLSSCYKKNIPVVVTLHDAALFCPNSVMRIHEQTYCDKELCISGNYLHCILNKCRGNSYLKSTNAAIKLFINRNLKSLDRVSAFVTPSLALKKLAIKYGIPDSKISVIPNFVDKDYLSIPANYEKGKYFLYVGRLGKEKGVHYLLEAFAKLPEGIKLRIVGTGLEKENLEKQTMDLNLKNVEFVGSMSGEDLLNEYKNSIATVLPCDWFECFGLTIIESFACSKPVIASNLGGIPEIITDKTGILVEPGNVDSLVQAVKKIYYNDDYLLELSKNCKQRSENYSRENYYNDLIKLYEDVLQRRNVSK